MADDGKPDIERLTTGVPTLDGILGGAPPAAPAPARPFWLSRSSSTRRMRKENVYFTSIAEPALRFLRYAQRFDFFDPRLVGDTLFISDLSGPALSQGLEKTIERLKQRIDERGPPIAAEGRSQELAYAPVKTLRAMGVTTVMTSETPQILGTAELTAHGRADADRGQGRSPSAGTLNRSLRERGEPA